MCGVVGIVYKDGRVVEPGDLQRMTATLAHRGPDDEGYFISGSVGLGHTRLSIIDLKTGRQPYRNETDTVWAVFNGEIYNFQELRDRLMVRGHRFQTASDGEVIVHHYEEASTAFLDGLDGMFAIALWDAARQRLVLARDRCGKKPLYYCDTPTAFLFASELKAMLALPWVERRVDPIALHHFLSLSYTPGEWTMLKGIRKLLPGHVLVYEDGRHTVRRYWDLRMAPDPNLSASKAVEQLEHVLTAAVRARLVSDVPLGFFLSGGIDSSVVVALARSISNAPIHTFSIGFSDPSYSELAHAREVAHRFGTTHHEQVLDGNPRDVLERIVWLSDEPSADSSAIPTYFLSKMARESITVALSGDGGDELFAGYLTHQAYKVARMCRYVPGLVRRGIVAPIVHSLPVSTKKVSLEYRMKRFVDGLDLDPLRAHYWWNGAFGDAEKDALYSEASREAIGPVDTRDVFAGHFDRYPNLDPLTRLLYVDFKTYLPDDILVKVDRMSMGNSLEVRCPLLDHHVVEFVGTIPTPLKLRGLTRKFIFRRFASSLLPGHIINRKKSGFSVPLDTWLRRELREMVEDTLTEARIRREGFFAWSTVRDLLAEHMEGRRNNAYRIWPIFIFMLWHGMNVATRPLARQAEGASR